MGDSQPSRAMANCRPGLETSMDVQFSVDVVPGQSLGQTRVENADSVMVMGTGGSLDEAMKARPPA